MEPQTPNEALSSHEQPLERPQYAETAAPRNNLTRPLIGLAFLTVSVLGAAGIFVALVPSVAYVEPTTQLAAVATRRAEAFKDVSLEATSAYVYDIRRDSELYGKNPSAQLPLA